jgi:hypothetical protein
MGRPGSAVDNAVIESWHSTLEFELRRVEHYATRAAARAGVAARIEDYNHHRRHSSLGEVSPGGLRAVAGGKGARVTVGRPLRGPGPGGGFAAAVLHHRAAGFPGGGRAARRYGAAPPASSPSVTAGQPRTVQLPGTRTREDSPDPGDLCDPSGRKYGPGPSLPRPGRGASGAPARGTQTNARERSELAFDTQKKRRNYTNQL